MKPALVTAARALDPMLQLFESVGDRRLRRAISVGEHSLTERVTLDFGDRYLVFRADCDDDALGISAVDSTDTGRGDDVSRVDPWAGVIAERFGWGWVTLNQQGYLDGVLLSFGGLVPQIVLNVMASTIIVGQIKFPATNR